MLLFRRDHHIKSIALHSLRNGNLWELTKWECFIIKANFMEKLCFNSVFAIFLARDVPGCVEVVTLRPYLSLLFITQRGSQCQKTWIFIHIYVRGTKSWSETHVLYYNLPKLLVLQIIAFWGHRVLKKLRCLGKILVRWHF